MLNRISSVTVTLITLSYLISAPVQAKFLQADPIGYQDNMNMYLYVGNDPVNMRDPIGLAQCGDNLQGQDCTDVLDDSDAARDNLKSASQLISGIADKVSAGEALSEAEQGIVALVQSRFGNKFGSAGNLSKVANGLREGALKIGARGEGAIIRIKESAGAFAHVNSGNRYQINISQNFVDSSNSNLRQHALAHESIHLTGRGVDIYTNNRSRGRSGYFLHEAVAHNNRRSTRNPFDLINNADSYACSVPAYQASCGK